MNKLEILQTIAEIKTIAENEQADSKDFLPLKKYDALGNPNLFLIIGGRGTGKTRLFCTLRKPGGFQQILGKQRNLFYPDPEKTEFLTGYYHEDKKFPYGKMMEKLVEQNQVRIYWQGSAFFVLLHHYREDKELCEIAQNYFSADEMQMFSDLKNLRKVSEWLPIAEKKEESLEYFFDDFDDYLENHDRWIFLLYDSLDRICPKYINWFPFIRGLLSFWFDHLHRWKRIKSKIFLRNDLYQSDKLAFPDSSKIVANQYVLEWNTVSLYRLLLKKMANAEGTETLDYLRKIPNLIGETPDDALGYIPTEDEKIIKKFITMMIGPFMGANAKKGDSYSWVPNHLQDYNGILAPRSFLKCFSVAAKSMEDKPTELEKFEGDDRILSPSMIQGAVQEVSKDRVAELAEEYIWIDALKKALNGVTMLMKQDEFIRLIHMDLWDDNSSAKEQLPATTPQGIFETLQKLGIVYIARDGRVNVPEIYLHGFGMKRKGGLRRPR